MFKKIGLLTAGLLLFSYFTLCLLLLWGQKKLIFIPDSQLSSTPQKYQLNYQDIWIKIEQEQIHGWWIPHENKSAPVMLYFHGNASNNGDIVDNAAIFHQLGLSVLLIDYRGYGKSSTTFPSEKRVYEDAEAAWQYLTEVKQIEPDNIFVYGHSLGGAIAINLAIKQPNMAGLITEGTFTSIKEMGALNPIFKLLPLNFLVTQRFDSINKISSLKVPILMFHGSEDEIIPVEMAKQLFNQAPQPKELIFISQAQHNNLHQVGDPKYIFNLQKFVLENSEQQISEIIEK